MNREYQVVYSCYGTANTMARPLVEDGPVQTVNVIAPGPDVPLAQFTEAGFRVIAVNEVRAVVDWGKPNYDLDEAGAYCGMKGVTFSKNKGDGKTPWVNYGRGLVPRAWLDRFLLEHANEPGREIARQLAV